MCIRDSSDALAVEPEILGVRLLKVRMGRGEERYKEGRVSKRAGMNKGAEQTGRDGERWRN
eukprot:755435-Hanusia_phi.AAC.2